MSGWYTKSRRSGTCVSREMDSATSAAPWTARLSMLDVHITGCVHARIHANANQHLPKRHPDTEIGHFGHFSDILHHDPQMTEFLPHSAGFSGTAPAVCVHADRFTGNSHRLRPWDRCLREHRRAFARNRPPVPQPPSFSGWRIATPDRGGGIHIRAFCRKPCRRCSFRR